MAEKPERNANAYDIAVQMTLAAIQSGSIRTADDACAFLESVFAKLLDLRGKAIDAGEYDLYSEL